MFNGIDGLSKHLFQNMFRDFIIVASFSLIANTWANQNWNKRYPVLWSILILEWKCNLAISLIEVYNRAEITFQGKTVITILVILEELHLTC